MSRKLESIWDCSRMVMPEHKQRIIREEREQERRVKPTLDPQEIELIDRALYKSMEEHSPVTLTLFAPFGDSQYKGIVMKIDRQMGIKIRWSEDDWDWIKMNDVISVT
ncbi:MAG: YolD-like family protein [Paenibacillus sp.]|nr:YolD-like family protein [Paenibacillus sp.]